MCEYLDHQSYVVENLKENNQSKKALKERIPGLTEVHTVGSPVG